MKYKLMAFSVVFAATTCSHAASGFSNTSASNVPVNDRLARVLAYSPIPKPAPHWSFVEKPTQHYYLNGHRYDYHWQGVWILTDRPRSFSGS